MNISKGIDDAVHDAFRFPLSVFLCLRGCAGFVEPISQRFSLNVFHDEALTYHFIAASGTCFHIFHTLTIHNLGMVEFFQDFHLLVQHLTIDGIATQFGKQCFQQIPSSVTLGLVKVASTGGWQCHDFGEFTVDAFVVGGDIT